MSRDDLDLEQKMNLIKDSERGLSYRELRNKFQVSIGAVSNILKRKNEYITDYETNLNKRVKCKVNNHSSQTINDSIYEWFVAQRAKKVPVSDPILQAYARKIAEEMGDSSGFKASNGWLERFRNRYNVRFLVIIHILHNYNRSLSIFTYIQMFLNNDLFETFFNLTKQDLDFMFKIIYLKIITY
ncbi:unnamed protein product [Rotaria magnacalcarata]|uniref:HTH CENPB-type domain-containing protein n=1 Tax=Rotaria magnacalcarata TaxID=392030 RepID=A0A816VRP7_9BILA|nr:unnamed protein product [Rotaria magnacalcarata]